ncbi:MAG TPA: 5-oxoprolinase subunit PxpA [Glaciihabitans sp.]|nr:5-oxoprolinase subunit PxpA [Glaciihabitans sp.]
MVVLDLNSDLGESYGQWTLGDDAAMFTLVTSANIACGFHAGDPLTMLACSRYAAAHGTVVGAHVSYRDLAGFGRREMDIAASELHGDVLYQLSALAGLAGTVGTPVRYVKPHGALYNRIVRDEIQAGAVAAAVRDFDPTLPLLGLRGSAIERAADTYGLPFFYEGFPDRALDPSGGLAPRSTPGSVITDPATVAARAVAMAHTGDFDSLCVHGDTPGAVAIATAVRIALVEAGIEIRSFL